MTTRQPYLRRINAVIDHIRAHPEGDLSLAALAGIAGFSPFHFHRIFSGIVGETVHDFVLRVRLDRAAALMKGAPSLSALDAALASGFTSASVFSRAFKRRYGLSPRAWDRRSPLRESKNGQVIDGFPRYTVEALGEVAGSGEFAVRVRSLPPQRLAYVRVTSSYRPEPILAAYDNLCAWYRARGGDPLRATLIGMSQDDPEVTPLELCHYDICLTAPPGWQGAGAVAVRDFPACRLATLHCEGDIYRVDRAWQYLYRHWLPRSRYQPDNLPALEIFRRQPAEVGWEWYDLECAVPVVGL
jgi:AraC family transcriptional regulator